jgi:sugar phosphate isomerase/epimerase
MKRDFNRRDFTKIAAMAGFGITALPVIKAGNGNNIKAMYTADRSNLKISLNAYSFDKPLRAGTMTIDDLLDYCAKTGFDGVDLTGYYFPGYPAVPTDEYIYHVKQKAFRLGVELGCTGVKNDFTWSDPAKRKEEKNLVKNWIIVAQKLGAPGVRIFAGTLSKENFSWEERAKWIAEDVRECADFGKEHGVMLALQNHNDFLKRAADVEKMLEMITHEWVGLMLDIGSYHTDDPYADIASTSKYAITWQLKEKVFIKETQVDTDFVKIIGIVKQCGYKGYLPLETLGAGDPVQKVETLFNKVQGIINS